MESTLAETDRSLSELDEAGTGAARWSGGTQGTARGHARNSSIGTDMSMLENDSQVAEASFGASIDTFMFPGVHHTFHEHSAAISRVLFANQNRNLLACASLDTRITLTTAAAAHPQVLDRLEAHAGGVTDVCWSVTNEYLASAGLDATLRIWDVQRASVLRTVAVEEPLSACLFHPMNDNIVVVGTKSGKVKVVNVSTGLCEQTHKLGGPVSCLEFENLGRGLFAGDEKGNVHYLVGDAQMRFTHTKRVKVASKAVTSVRFLRWERHSPVPAILVSSCDNALRLFRVQQTPKLGISLERQFTVAHRSAPLRAIFCPLLTHSHGAPLVTGTEDMTVDILDPSSASRPVLAKLQGHTAAVIDVSFSYDESVLASGDNDGVVMLWRRAAADSA